MRCRATIHGRWTEQPGAGVCRLSGRQVLACALAGKAPLVVGGHKELFKVSGYGGVVVVRPRYFVDDHLRRDVSSPTPEPHGQGHMTIPCPTNPAPARRLREKDGLQPRVVRRARSEHSLQQEELCDKRMLARGGPGKADPTWDVAARHPAHRVRPRAQLAYYRASRVIDLHERAPSRPANAEFDDCCCPQRQAP